MKKLTLSISMIVVMAILMTACSSAAPSTNAAVGAPIALPAQVQPTAASSSAVVIPPSTGTLADYESTMETIYKTVNPSVVNINVEATSTASTPNIFGRGNNQPQVTQSLGSGFVWDSQGDIVTNNHVVEGATSITVSFSDDSTYPATLVGADANSDLAVIKVDAPASLLKPVTLGDSSKLTVGQVAIAIGEPYGETGTMTSGIISALGRSLPVDMNATGPTYTIPDVIQTDAAINPGNSGGVLLNTSGQVIGVTSAIESSSGSGSGVGFAIPINIVKKVIPSLIATGKYDHPYLGITGTNMTASIASAMNLPTTTRGALVVAVTAGGPAASAGLKASANQVTINGTSTTVGGDVIVSIDGHEIKGINDVIAYLEDSTIVGQKITMSVLRNGSAVDVSITLGARPSTTAAAPVSQPTTTTQNLTNSAYLGITGLQVNAEIAAAMGLPVTQTGILVQTVTTGSPAEQAGLQPSTKQVTVLGQNVNVGGDIITAIDGKSVNTLQDLRTALSSMKPGDKANLSVLRNNSTLSITVTLGTAPSNGQ